MKKSSISNTNGNIVKSSKSSITVPIRLPRPNGATALASEAFITKDSLMLKKFRDFMINHWLLSNGSICGTQYNSQTLAKGLGIPVEEIRIKMRDTVMTSRIWDKESQEKIIYGLIGELVGWTLEDRMKINAQIEILTKSQGGKYTPFISAELNKALKLGLESGTALQGVLGRIMGGGGTTNIFNLLQQNNDNSVTNNFVTTSQVLEILNDENKQLDKPDQAKLLEARYDLQALPEVVATHQEGIDTSREGLGGKINVAELNSITDDFKGAMEAAEEDHHSMRREIEQRVDPDAEDPELDIYDDYEDVSSDKEFSTRNFLNS